MKQAETPNHTRDQALVEFSLTVLAYYNGYKLGTLLGENRTARSHAFALIEEGFNDGYNKAGFVEGREAHIAQEIAKFVKATKIR